MGGHSRGVIGKREYWDGVRKKINNNNNNSHQWGNRAYQKIGSSFTAPSSLENVEEKSLRDTGLFLLI